MTRDICFFFSVRLDVSQFFLTHSASRPNDRLVLCLNLMLWATWWQCWCPWRYNDTTTGGTDILSQHSNKHQLPKCLLQWVNLAFKTFRLSRRLLWINWQKATHNVSQQKIHSSELSGQSRASMFHYCQKIPGLVLVKFVFPFFQVLKCSLVGKVPHGALWVRPQLWLKAESISFPMTLLYMSSLKFV